ncbi:hypothetical protein BJX70DRAFT_204705 [Aspergillus crustosus]
MTSVEDSISDLTIAGGVLLAVPLVTVFLRCYVRIWLVKAFGWDDGLMVLAMCFHIVLSICVIGAGVVGIGEGGRVTPQSLVAMMKYWWIGVLAQAYAADTCKISICIFLLRVSARMVYKWIIYGVAILSVLLAIKSTAIQLVQCQPIDYFWLRFDPMTTVEGSCFSAETYRVLTYVYVSIAGTSDLVLGLLPVFIVRKLQISLFMKVQIAVILGLAWVASIALFVRLAYTGQYGGLNMTNDVNFAIWSAVEPSLGITAASLATLRPLFKKCHPRSSQDDESPSSERARRPLRRHGVHDLSYPLTTLGSSIQSRIRRDKWGSTVREFETQQSREADTTHSQERLHLERQETLAVSDDPPRLGVYATYLASQPSDVEPVRADERV